MGDSLTSSSLDDGGDYVSEGVSQDAITHLLSNPSSLLECDVISLRTLESLVLQTDDLVHYVQTHLRRKKWIPLAPVNVHVQLQYIAGPKVK